MRQTDYRRRNTMLNEQIAEDLQQAAQAELNWLFRQLRYKVRRLDARRAKVVTGRPALWKFDPSEARDADGRWTTGGGGEDKHRQAILSGMSGRWKGYINIFRDLDMDASTFDEKLNELLHDGVIEHKESVNPGRNADVDLYRIKLSKSFLVPSSSRLQKSYIVSGNLWDTFVERMTRAILKALKDGVIKLFDLQRKHAGGPEPVEYSSEAFAKQIEPELGKRIVGETDTIKRMVGRRVVGWYNSPGATMQSLVDQLKPTFGETRARLIAQTEITYLDSAVKRMTAEKTGATEWWWSSRRDSIVCVKPLIGPDGQIYKGCRELHGKVFNIGLPMPPGGSHIGCRCGAVIMRVKRVRADKPATQVIEGLMKFDESEHPRASDGEFTDKGAGSGNGSVVLSETAEKFLSTDREKLETTDEEEIKRLNQWAEDYENSNRMWREAIANKTSPGGVVQRPWNFDDEPEWSINARDAYVVNDPRTLRRNSALRKGESVPESWTNQIDKWTQSSTIAKDTTVYRSALFSDKQLEELKVGGSFVDDAYMSVSNDIDLAKHYAGIRQEKSSGSAALFYISVKKGQECGDAGQDEIVFPRGSSLIITKITPPSSNSPLDENSYWRIYANK